MKSVLAREFCDQLIEAVFSKKSLIVFEYPVYKSDIAPLGFEFISIGDEAHYDEDEGFYRVGESKLEKAAERLKELLTHPEELANIVEKNFEIGKEHLSLKKLQQYLADILKRF